MKKPKKNDENNNDKFNANDEFAKNMTKLMGLLKKMLVTQQINQEDVKAFFKEISQEKSGVNLNMFFAFMPLSDPEFDEIAADFEEFFEAEHRQMAGGAELKFELNSRDKEFLKKNGLRF